MLIAGPLLGFFASGIFSGFGPYLSELFPSAVRGAGQGFCYNLGRGVAGIGPFAIGWLSARYAIGTAMTAVAVLVVPARGDRGTVPARDARQEGLHRGMSDDAWARRRA